MKNVLILSASPRKNGNSDMLCDRFFLLWRIETEEIRQY